ncbi:hypothetical protein Mal4_53150 [Maioricimonas rarisocia]|uniref:Uncharacterized protein n=1 Tax=Maioricimonas rarisocia TaxID=2528026 RepID=A0A517ZEQ4_9PLAN|nr:hypothetical protein Mal4_53150 [Maioricimonas rarisocia]
MVCMCVVSNNAYSMTRPTWFSPASTLTRRSDIASFQYLSGTEVSMHARSLY